MKTASQIANDILSSNLSNEDLRVLQEAMREAWDLNTRKAKFQFRVGDKVQFHNSRNGMLVKGTVTKIAIKNIQMKADTGGNWNVSPTLLQKL